MWGKNGSLIKSDISEEKVFPLPLQVDTGQNPVSAVALGTSHGIAIQSEPSSYIQFTN